MDSRIEQEIDEYMYRVYISDGLYSALGVYKQRYIDMLNNIREPDEEVNAEEIVERVMNNGGLVFKE